MSKAEKRELLRAARQALRVQRRKFERALKLLQESDSPDLSVVDVPSKVLELISDAEDHERKVADLARDFEQAGFDEERNLRDRRESLRKQVEDDPRDSCWARDGDAWFLKIAGKMHERLPHDAGAHLDAAEEETDAV